ncbi:AAA family ATPase [Nocardioides mangrovicus]|uniref:AAA family ATPase n=1 Tax=Nocardioides mangrovicus TaxID=2478913 RepID=A0A3L8P6N4_9ACTN|nr:AAA family ATPase [Nocardioides mangrovicus]RLV50373.1 AAA family ATPase [Nocardioides mangrovicus]
MLGAGDPLPARPSRVVVAGVSGAGKTTYAQAIAARLAIPHVEIDALYHGENWVPRPSFDRDVDALVARPAWVTEWHYASARPKVAARAEVMVWLDLPFRITLFRVVRRTLRRRLRREVLWNGNREGPLWRFLVDPEHVVRWSVSTRHRYDDLVPAVAATAPELVVVRLRSRADAARWLDALA